MKTRNEFLKTNFDENTCTIQGGMLHKLLCGFAEILDNTGANETVDPDLVDVYLAIGFKNGTTIQVTGQITDIYMAQHQNVVKLSIEDRKAFVMPPSVFIFSLNDVVSIQSLDVVTHQKRLAARMEQEAVAEDNRQEAVKEQLKTEGLDVDKINNLREQIIANAAKEKRNLTEDDIQNELQKLIMTEDKVGV